MGQLVWLISLQIRYEDWPAGILPHCLMWRRSGVFKILSDVCDYGQVPYKPLVIYNFKHHRFGLVRFWPCVITQLWWGSCSNLPENGPSLRYVKLGTHQEETPITQQILLKRFWMFGNWISLRDFPWEVVPQKLWILVQTELRLSRRLKSLKKKVWKPVWGNLISSCRNTELWAVFVAD